MSKKAFRFAVQAFNSPSPRAWRDLIRRTEDSGYSAFHLADHILGSGAAMEAAAHPPQMLAAVPAIASALEMTTRIKVGCRVFCMDYRQPVVLAKEAATMHWLSEGRLELGLGAGWIGSEYAAIGLRFDDIGVRLRRFAEVVQGVKAFMRGGPVQVEGEWINWSGFSALPEVSACPPIMIGGGSKGILSLAAREADIVSLNFNNRSGTLGQEGVVSGLAEQTARKIGWIREAAGTRFEALELEIGAYLTVVTDHQEATASAIAAQLGISSADLLAGPHNLVGSVDYICEELERRREVYGINYITVLEDGDNDIARQFAPVVARLAGR
jgi:probable F420-dependent oxidoreductase